MYTQDSVYARRPWSSLQEQQVTNYLAQWTDLPADAVRNIAPPIPNIGRTPPRFGYSSYVPGIADIVRLDELYPGSRIDYSQSQSGFSGTFFPALGVM
ncbi:hypothetical protein [Streptomyces sp. CBMA29]|uniref:hypothetical protein n=1 Tax=Streptomyces sp. CBMA29 TaxID=1896314 RepID=UPI001661D7DE|nr:hypothetical protein [Streptomyces sp. CBMA29]MBD0734103.1 hypothetical protein [Streptomyces sp. CBMA29]